MRIVIARAYARQALISSGLSENLKSQSEKMKAPWRDSEPLSKDLERVAVACTVRSPGFSRNRLALEPFRLKAGLQTSVH
jgi:hypothetical protein